MATVYRARDTRLDRWVAVKVMHPHLRGTDEARARFAREARAVARLKHPAILEIYDYSDSESADAYIATELLTGPTLKGFVESVDEVPAEIAACIGMELSRALEAAHKEGIIHRDVKPENVLLHQGRDIKLTDFGIADMLDPSMSHMTATGQLLGSPAHMAPEQVEGGDCDERSDVFAVGTILYWLSTGALPFSGKNPHQVLKRVVDCAPVDPLLVRPTIGAPLCRIIMRCLQKEPAARFQSAQLLASALAELLLDMGIDSPKAQLEIYLRDPGAESALLRGRVLAQLLRKAQISVAARDRRATIESVDRALALEDGNPRALALLRELDHSARARLLLQGVAGLGGLAALVGLWLAFAPAQGENGPGTRLGGSSPPTSSPQSAPRDLPVSAEPTTGPAASAPEMQPSGALSTRPRAAAPRQRQPSRPRTVVFAPEPANVTISVDGAPAKAFGPAFNKLEVEPGPHTFRFVGAHQCCDDAVVQLDVPSGPGETVVRAKLAFRDAALYVASNVPADVSLDGVAMGRALSVIKVPLSRGLLERRKISVTATGHEPYTGYVQLRAGEVAQFQVTLQPGVPH